MKIADKTKARTRTDELKSVKDNFVERIKEAYDERFDIALGYTSWEAYLISENLVVHYPKEERPKVVRALHTTGLSTRAISRAVGIAPSTVRSDLERFPTVRNDVERLRWEAGGQFRPPHDQKVNDRPRTVTGLDGKIYQIQPPCPKPSITFKRIPTPFKYFATEVEKFAQIIMRQHDLTPEQSRALGEAVEAWDRFAATATAEDNYIWETMDKSNLTWENVSKNEK